MRIDKKLPQKIEKKAPARVHKRGVVGYSKKSALLEEAITHMNTGKYGRSSTALKELLALDPHNTEARRLFATLHLRLGSLVTARQAFESLANEAIGRQDYWLAESLLREYLAAGPRCVPFLELLAHVYKEKGDEMAAVAELAKAINILVEDPDTDNPKKPAELYAMLRELAPASPAAIQLASFFDIQTGEFLVRHAPAPPSFIPSNGSALSSTDHTIPTADIVETSEPMPWERLDTIPSQDSAALSISTAPPVEQVDDSATESCPEPVSFEPLPVESAPSNSPWNSLNPDGTSFLSAASTDAAGAPPVMPLPTSIESQDWEMLLKRSTSEELPVSSEQTPLRDAMPSPSHDDQTDFTPSLGSTVLPSPMPWEQIEHHNISIIETAPLPVVTEPEPVASTPSPPTLEWPEVVQAEPVDDMLPVPATIQEPVASTIAEPEPPSIVLETALPSPTEPTAPTPPAPTSTSFSWNAIFDGVWKFGIGTSAPSPPATLASVEATESNRLDMEERVTVSEPPRIEPASELAEPIGTLLSTSESSTASVEADAPPVLSQTLPIGEGPISSSTSAWSNDDPIAPQPTSWLIQQEAVREDAPPVIVEKASSTAAADWSAPVVPAPIDEGPSISVPTMELPPMPSTVQEPEPFVTTSSATSTISNAAPAAEPMPVEEAIQLAPPPVPPIPSSHWSTGEVTVQTHRPSKKKRRWGKENEEAAVESPIPTSAHEDVIETTGAAPARWDTVPEEPVVPVPEPPVPWEDNRPEWARASDEITFANTDPPVPQVYDDSAVSPLHAPLEPLRSSAAASAVDVLFASPAERTYTSTHERMSFSKPRPRLSARVARIRQGLSLFTSSCFATTRAMVISFAVLILTCIGALVAGIGAVGLVWMIMEEPPSPAYQNLTTSPTRTVNDPARNGYFLLLGFEAPSDRDPVQAGYERRAGDQDRTAAAVCLNGGTSHGNVSTTKASASVMRGWFSGADPAASFKGQGESIRMWAAEQSTGLARYRQWLKMSFDDGGYGQIISPNCAQILHVHRLYLAEGFSQDLPTGLDRLETDMSAWRAALAQSKTLMVKMLAAAAIQDDAALTSAWLIRPDLDEATLSRLNKIVRPLDQVELSLRWPMQSHLVWGSKDATTSLKHSKTDERPLHVSLAASMSLPVQRRSNAYAEYYEAANKAVAEGRYASLPKLSAFLRTPATGFMDYLANPLEHVIGIDPMPAWGPYVGRMVELDARLRLASLQAWIRRGPQEGDLLARLAKAGQSYYDPVTGLPMLVNQQKGLLYSVGPDGKDQDADPVRDVVAKIPPVQSTTTLAKRSAASSSK